MTKCQLGTALVIALSVSFARFATPQEMHKCIKNGVPTFQSEPCPEKLKTVGETMQAERRALEQRKEILEKQRVTDLAAARERTTFQYPYCPDNGQSMDERLDAYKRKHPKSGKTDVALVIDGINEKLVGLPEELLIATFCEFVKSVNTTATAAGTTKQYILNFKPAQYLVYTRNGVITGIQY